jgi:RNA polymerase sigma factor (sigma-70 family)
MRDDPVVTALVTDTRNGDKEAWDTLVERYAPPIWSICRRHRLGDANASDVDQRVWLQLAEHLDKIGDPAALPGWLATTTRRECARVQRAARSTRCRSSAGRPDHPGPSSPDSRPELLAAERHATLREALARLPPSCQRLITLLIQAPPLPYATISAGLDIPVGSVGPNRGRCLDRLRCDPAITALTSAAAETQEVKLPGKRVHSHDEQPMAS